MSKSNYLKIINARENNLKNVNLEIPHDELVVITGLSGSGKSTLAFDTIYAEGQRRYIETFSAYTRQFFDKIKKPLVDSLNNVRPAIAIQQRTKINNSRSTVGSLTNINDYSKLLWHNLAKPCCQECKQELRVWNAKSISLEAKKLSGVVMLAAEIRASTKQLKKEIDRLQLLGFSRIWDPIEKSIIELEDLKLNKQESILVIIERFKAAEFDSKQLLESIEQAISITNTGVYFIDEKKEHYFALAPVCCGIEYKLSKRAPGMFTYNSPLGACTDCRGFGNILAVDPAAVVSDRNLSIQTGAVGCWPAENRSREYLKLIDFCEQEDIPVDLPWHQLSKEQQDLIFDGKGKNYKGLKAWFKALERKAYKMHVRVFLAKYRSQFVCPTCEGKRYKPESLLYRISGLNLAEIGELAISDLIVFFETYFKSNKLEKVLSDLGKSLLTRLHYMHELGLPYLNLGRQARTLSGGETQRVNLVSALGSDLVSTQFVLDEPSVGLHARDTAKLIQAVKNLSAKGNSVLVVEHDPEFITAADHIIELGPHAGNQGGNIVYNGKISGWSNPIKLIAPETKNNKHSEFLKVKCNNIRNLKNLDLNIPLNSIVCITGVSGSGKSTLIEEVILKDYADHLRGLEIKQVQGFEKFNKVLAIDQSALAKSPRANIATYTGIWDRVRDLFAAAPDAQNLGLTKSHFSFNVEAGRCSHCSGAGYIKEDMQFLSDVYLPCEMCRGKRFKPEVLECRYNLKNVDDLLNMTVSEIINFTDEKQIKGPATVLQALGLGHLRLGHSLSELSGGEAQRLRLVPFINQSSNNKNLIIFDEPTTGLHFEDVKNFINVLLELKQSGNSIIVVEHNLDLIAAADWILDLGPEAGTQGGELVKTGTPAEFIKNSKGSITAEYLKDHFKVKQQNVVKFKKTEASKFIEIKGAKEHNLKNIDLKIPLNKFIAFTGVSGSGKSTIAKDIIYAEGQRRYLDCLSPYARQFITELKRPNIDEIHNIPPTICVYQHTFQPGRLSTIATMSEVYNLLRLLYAKAANQYCPDHDVEIEQFSAELIAKEIKNSKLKQVRILAPIIKKKKGEHREVIERAIRMEVAELRVDGIYAKPQKLTEGLVKNKVHSIEYVLARCSPDSFDEQVLSDVVSQALLLGAGTLIVSSELGDRIYSSERSCPVCKRGVFRPDPEDLSFNSNRGACATCEGTGVYKDKVCKDCNGDRLNSYALSLKIDGFNISQLCRKNSAELSTFFAELNFPQSKLKLLEQIKAELEGKLLTLAKLGLDHLNLNRDCTSLSNGEMQRLRIAAAVGSPLAGALYIFDEPSAGLHPTDNLKVLGVLQELQNRNNSLIIIEHDPQSILAAEHIIDVGPQAGKFGGEIVFNGSREDFLRSKNSINAQELSQNRSTSDSDFKIKDSLQVSVNEINNIKKLDLNIPYAAITSVIGVSGAGKSSLVHSAISDCINYGKETKAGLCWKSANCSITSDKEIDRVLLVDQKPIGTNCRSTPASYLGIWDEIRKIFAATIEARSRGWTNSFFSFNSGTGRCLNCKGQGELKIEMSFLADARVECPICSGSRFSLEAESVKYLAHNISQVLNLTFLEAKELFSNHKKIYQSLKLGCELGLSYLTLGQSSASLSGGESQRIKLISELSKPNTKSTLYILDEPSTGLHRDDVKKVIQALKQLASNQHTIILIEHDLDLIMASDYLIEMGPGAGDAGGQIVYQGNPNNLDKAQSPWGNYLRHKSLSAKLC